MKSTHTSADWEERIEEILGNLEITSKTENMAGHKQTFSGFLSDEQMEATTTRLLSLIEEAYRKGFIDGSEDELECVRNGGHDDVGPLSTKTKTSYSGKFHKFKLKG